MSGIVDLALRLDTRWVLAFYLLVLDVWAIALIWKARPGRRDGAIWSAIVLFCPIVGCLFWYALGPKPTGEPAGS